MAFASLDGRSGTPVEMSSAQISAASGVLRCQGHALPNAGRGFGVRSHFIMNYEMTSNHGLFREILSSAMTEYFFIMKI